MKGKRIVAVDVGSTCVVIAVGSVEDDGRVNIEGIVSEPITNGVVAGRIDNSDVVGQAIANAKQRIERQLNIRVTEVYAGLSGDFIRCEQVTDHVYVQDELRNGSNQITQRDLDELCRRMQSVKLPDDREIIISMEPLRYKVDEKEVEIPVGTYGHVLSATYNFILCDKSMRDRLRQCMQSQGITVKEFVSNTLVSHLAVATTEDMQDGSVIIDLGGGVTDVTVIQNSKVRYIASIPIGMAAINEDIRSWGIPTTYVEKLKVQCGSAVAELADDDNITFPPRKGTPKNILRKNLAAIIEARLSEIAEWVQREIKEAGCGSRYNPSIILTGGGSQLRHIEELFKRILGYEDVRAVHPEYGITEESLYEHVSTPAYSTVVSLLLFGAKRGSCSVTMLGGDSVHTVAAREERQEPITETRPIAAEERKEPEKRVQRSLTVELDDKLDDIDNDEFGGDDIEPKKKSWFKDKANKWFKSISESFTHEDEERI